MSAIPLPKSLWSARDAVIDAFHNGREAEDELKQIKDWLKLDGWDSPLEKWESILDLQQIKQYLNDKEFALGWVGEDAEITDKMRIEHARQMLTIPFEGGDYSVFTAHLYKLESKDGRSVTLGGTMEIIPGGPEVSWAGLYKDEAEFMLSLKGWSLTLEQVGEKTDKQLLALWQK